MALVNSNRNPLAKVLLKQAADKMKFVKSLVSCNKYLNEELIKTSAPLGSQVVKCQATVKKGFCEKERPFVKTLDNALQSFGVQLKAAVFQWSIYWQPCP